MAHLLSTDGSNDERSKQYPVVVRTERKQVSILKIKAEVLC
jgi:hypothetical protein